ncbi:MAG: PqqD family protein [Dongiaceae bacterium]
MTERLALRSPAVVQETIDGESVIINLDTGRYFSLDGAAAEAWQALVAGQDASEVARRIALGWSGPPAEIEAAVAGFFAEVQAEGLVRPATPDDAPAVPPAPAAAAAPQPFAGLRLRRYDDLEELLLLDPVHDVDESGWPHQAPPA